MRKSIRSRFTQSDIDNWFQQSFNLRDRTIYMSSIMADSDAKETGVDAFMAEYVIKALHLMKGSSRPVRILMNNPGGYWFHGMAIYDSIRTCPAPVDIEVYGQAMSMGAVILQAGRRRLMHLNSALMIHDGTTSIGEVPAQTARNWSNYEEGLRTRMYEIFSGRSGKYPSYWKRRCSHDTIMTPEKAIEEGLADEMIIPTRELPIIKRPRKKR